MAWGPKHGDHSSGPEGKLPFRDYPSPKAVFGADLARCARPLMFSTAKSFAILNVLPHGANTTRSVRFKVILWGWLPQLLHNLKRPLAGLNVGGLKVILRTRRGWKIDDCKWIGDE